MKPNNLGDISDAAVQAIQDSVKTEIITVNEIEYTTREVFEPPPDPLTQALHLSTLTGLVDFIEHNIDELVKSTIAIHVVSHSCVRLVSAIERRDRQREVFINAEAEKIIGSTFSFGNFVDSETFIIALQSLFADAEDRAKVLAVVGNIKEENVRTTGDDGVTQAVTAKVGIARSENVEVPNPVTLIPFRTFREIEQPASTFILRMRQGREGQMPSCALFEADGGQWKLTAIESIRDYLKEHVDGVVVIA